MILIPKITTENLSQVQLKQSPRSQIPNRSSETKKIRKSLNLKYLGDS